MFEKLFGKKDSGAPDSVMSQERLRSIEGSTSADLAADLLTAPTALMQFTHEEARAVVSYMTPKRIEAGTTFIKQGDTRNTGFMLLILSGEVTVETIVVSRTEPVTVTVLGAGSLVGEMGLLDGEPRSASCTATADTRCAILTRQALEQLIAEEPRIGAKLMMAVSLRIAERLRDSADKLRLYAQLTQAMQQEIDRLMPT
jgi:CRP-like cAMP-binding protein